MNVLLLMLAVLPTFFLMVFIYYKDSYEKEPVGLLISLFALGMVSVIPALIIETLGELIFSSMFGDNTSVYNFFNVFFCVAIAEEGGKYIFTYLRTWNNKNFNYKFDGIVYAVLVSLGFATVENILYVMQGGLSVAIARGLLSVPSHAIDAVYMGYYYGLAKYYDSVGNTRSKNRCMVLSIIVPVILHGCYDYFLFEGTVLHLVVFLIFVVTLDVFAVIRINKSSKKNMKIYRTNPQMYDMSYVQQGTFGWQRNAYMFCTNCGARLNVNTFYCTNCGAPVHRI